MVNVVIWDESKQGYWKQEGYGSVTKDVLNAGVFTEQEATKIVKDKITGPLGFIKVDEIFSLKTTNNTIYKTFNDKGKLVWAEANGEFVAHDELNKIVVMIDNKYHQSNIKIDEVIRNHIDINRRWNINQKRLYWAVSILAAVELMLSVAVCFGVGK